MHKTWMTAYPWDIAGDNISSSMDQLHGEVGITGLAMWASIPPSTYLRIREIQPRVVHTRGGLLFHPTEENYESTRCKPIVSSKIKSRDPIDKIVHECKQRDMDVAIMVSTSFTGRLVQKHPEMACKNIFDSESQYSLCLTNPDVQSFLCSLVADLSQKYTPTSIIVADFIPAWIEAYQTATFNHSAIGGLERALLSICFCESCYQSASQAGVDVEMTKRSTKVMLQKSFEGGTASEVTFDHVLKDNTALQAFIHWRKGEMAALLKRIVGQCSGECMLDRSTNESINRPPDDVPLDTTDGVIDRVDQPDQLDTIFESPASENSAGRHELRIDHSLTLGSHGSELIGLISRATEKGCKAIHFDHYGLLPDSAMTTIKQAIRFARRSS